MNYTNGRVGFSLEYQDGVYSANKKGLNKGLLLYNKQKDWDTSLDYEISVIVMSKKEEEYTSKPEKVEDAEVGGQKVKKKCIDAGGWGKLTEVRVRANGKLVQLLLRSSDDKGAVSRFDEILRSFRVLYEKK